MPAFLFLINSRNQEAGIQLIFIESKAEVVQLLFQHIRNY